jgi:hypothetical protein
MTKIEEEIGSAVLGIFPALDPQRPPIDIYWDWDSDLDHGRLSSVDVDCECDIDCDCERKVQDAVANVHERHAS